MGASSSRAAEGRRRVDVPVVAQAVRQLLDYSHKVLYLNSMFFGVGQSRDRGYWVFWDKRLPTPDLDHRPPSPGAATARPIVQAVWTWKTGVPPTGSVRYGKQYNYRCPSCHREVVPPFTPSLAALDLTEPGHPDRRIAKPSRLDGRGRHDGARRAVPAAVRRVPRRADAGEGACAAPSGTRGSRWPPRPASRRPRSCRPAR